jgi:hypothetical protein
MEAAPVVVLLEVAWIALLGYRGAGMRDLGGVMVWLALLALELWEFDRWRTRRKYPTEPPHIA